MNSICIGNFNSRHDMSDVEVGITALWFADTYCFICKFYMQTITIGCGVNSYGFDTHLATSTNNS